MPHTVLVELSQENLLWEANNVHFNRLPFDTNFAIQQNIGKMVKVEEDLSRDFSKGLEVKNPSTVMLTMNQISIQMPQYQNQKTWNPLTIRTGNQIWRKTFGQPRGFDARHDLTI